MSIWTQITPLWEVNMSFETQAIPSWELITSLWKEKSPFEAQHLIIHKLNKRLCFGDSNCFVNRGSRELSDSDYENTVKIIGCDSHDKRNSSFGEVSVTDGPAKVNFFRKPDLRRRYRHFRQPLRMMGRRSRDREPSRISLTKLLRLMKCRKLRKKHKTLFMKSFPVSSVLHNIASNYKQWNIRYIQSLDCFYSSYFTKIK